MKHRFGGWRARALAVVGGVLGVLLTDARVQAECVGDCNNDGIYQNGANPSAILKAECVGDCNNDGMVTINELIVGVNIALGSAPVSACPSFANSQGVVDIAQLIKGVNNAQNGCPVEPTDTPTLPAGTATATITPTPTETPGGGGLGKHVCTLTGASQLKLQTVALPLALVPTGTLSVECGEPGADGTAACGCKVIEFGAVVIPAIGDVCVNPAEGCSPGTIACEGGRPLDVSLDADHNIGSCDGQAACAAKCDAYCGDLGATVTRQSSGCEGYCDGGTNDGASCDRDSDCPGGNCTGGEPVTHFDICNCVCAGTEEGPAGGAGSMACNLGTQINVELPSSGLCGDKPPAIQLAPVCGNVTTETSIGVVTNANNNPGATIPNPPPEVLEGAKVSCDDFKAGNITGLKLVGQLGFFDSTLGDIRSGNVFVCQ